MKFHLGKFVRFKDLEIGECFLDRNSIYKKKRKYRGKNAAWCLSSTSDAHFEPDRWVIPFEEDKL